MELENEMFTFCSTRIVPDRPTCMSLLFACGCAFSKEKWLLLEQDTTRAIIYPISSFFEENSIKVSVFHWNSKATRGVIVHAHSMSAYKLSRRVCSSSEEPAFPSRSKTVFGSSLQKRCWMKLFWTRYWAEFIQKLTLFQTGPLCENGSGALFGKINPDDQACPCWEIRNLAFMMVYAL